MIRKRNSYVVDVWELIIFPFWKWIAAALSGALILGAVVVFKIYGEKGEVQAAWIQAIGSVVALFFAIYVPVYFSSEARREQNRLMMGVLSILASRARTLIVNLRSARGGAAYNYALETESTWTPTTP